MDAKLGDTMVVPTNFHSGRREMGANKLNANQIGSGLENPPAKRQRGEYGLLSCCSTSSANYPQIKGEPLARNEIQVQEENEHGHGCSGTKSSVG